MSSQGGAEAPKRNSEREEREDRVKKQRRGFSLLDSYVQEEGEALPTERWKLRQRLRRAKLAVWNYENDVWDVESGGCDEHYFGECDAVQAIEFLLRFIPRDDEEDARQEEAHNVLPSPREQVDAASDHGESGGEE